MSQFVVRIAARVDPLKKWGLTRAHLPSGAYFAGQEQDSTEHEGDEDAVAQCDIGAFELNVGLIISDSFESGDTSAWSTSMP